MKPFVVIAVACLAILAGCAVGPDYQPPKPRAELQWNSSLVGGETNGPADLTAWWKNFGDTNLDSLMAMAVQSNLTLLVAEAHVRESRAERDVDAGTLWPSLGSSASYSRNRLGPPGFPPFAGLPANYGYYSAGFDAAWELDVFGGTRRTVESANAEIGAAEYGQRDVLVTLIAEVARNYIGARGYQQRLAITRDNIKVQQDILNLTTNRFQHGLGSDLDVQQATALLTATEAEVPSLETGSDQAVHHLAVLLGQQPGALMGEMSVAKPIPLTPPEVPVGLPSDLLLRRPDVQRAERELAAATARIGVAKADLYPKFSLTGFGGLESLSADHWFDYASRYWSAGPTVQWEIFEAGSIRANIRVQNARQEQALDAYQQIVLVALEDAENALTAYAREQVRRESLRQSVTANEQALEISTQLYKSGLTDFLQVLDTERSLYESQDELVQSDQSVSLDLVQLYKALGGGWTDERKPEQLSARR
jgi:multidrug efflux system outer membrane protein